MTECNSCGANIRPGMKICAACKAPVRGAGQAYRSPRHGFCEYNDHGLLCDKPGSIALHTGEGGPWYCSDHALGLRGMKKLKSSGPQNIKSHIKAFQEPDDEAMQERLAIQSEQEIC